MTSHDGKKGGAAASKDTRVGDKTDDRPAARPDWANGLRQLYDSVVEEDLPDTFKDLLSQLDDKA